MNDLYQQFCFSQAAEESPSALPSPGRPPPLPDRSFIPAGAGDATKRRYEHASDLAP